MLSELHDGALPAIPAAARHLSARSRSHRRAAALSVGDAELSFFSTTTVFGTPLDVTVAELAIEAFYPADGATAEALRRAADRSHLEFAASKATGLAR